MIWHKFPHFTTELSLEQMRIIRVCYIDSACQYSFPPSLNVNLWSNKPHLFMEIFCGQDYPIWRVQMNIKETSHYRCSFSLLREWGNGNFVYNSLWFCLLQTRNLVREISTSVFKIVNILYTVTSITYIWTNAVMVRVCGEFTFLIYQ